MYLVAQTLPPSRSCTSEQKKDELAYHLTEHLRMNGVYWGLTALTLMGQTNALPREEMIDWVMSCWDEEAGVCLSQSAEGR